MTTMTTKQTRPVLPHLEGTLEYLEATSTFFGGRNWEPKFVTVARSALVVSKSKPAYEKGHYLEQVDLLQVGICEANIEGSSKQHIFKLLGPGVDRSFSCKSMEELHNWINKLTNIKEHWTKTYQNPFRTTENHSNLIENGGDEHQRTIVVNSATKTFQLTLHMNNNIQQTINLPKQHSTFHDIFHELSIKTNCPDCSTCSIRKRNSRLYCVNKHGEIVHVEKDVPLYPYFKAGSTFFIYEQQTEQEQHVVVVHIEETYIACLIDTNITSEALLHDPLVVKKIHDSIGKSVCMVLLYEERGSVEKKMELLAHDDKPLSFLYGEDWEPKNSGRLVLKPFVDYLKEIRGKGTDELLGAASAVADMSAEEAVQLERGEITFRAVRLSSGQIILEKCNISSCNAGDHNDCNRNSDTNGNDYSSKNGLDPNVLNESKYPVLSEEFNLSKTSETSILRSLVDDIEVTDKSPDKEACNNVATKITFSPTGNINVIDENNNIGGYDNREASFTNVGIVIKDCGDVAPIPEKNQSNRILLNEISSKDTVDIHRVDSYRTVLRKHIQDEDPKSDESCINVDADGSNDPRFCDDNIVSCGGDVDDVSAPDGSVGNGCEHDNNSCTISQGGDIKTVDADDSGISTTSQVGIETDISDEVVKVLCPNNDFDTVGMIDSYASVRSLSLSSQDGLNVSIDASLFTSQQNKQTSEGDECVNLNQNSDHESGETVPNGEVGSSSTMSNKAMNGESNEPDIGNASQSKTTVESISGGNNDALIHSHKYSSSSSSKSTSPVLCHLCSSMPDNKRPSHIRSKESMKRFLDSAPNQGSYICLLGTHLLYSANGWELTDDCMPCNDLLHVKPTTEKLSRFNIGNGVICVWRPKTDNNPAMWLVKRVGESDRIDFNHDGLNDSDDDGETSSIERSFELPSREPEVAQKNNTSPLHSLMNTIRERKSSVKERYNVVIDSIDTDEIRDTLSNAKHHLVESAKLARSTFDSISEYGMAQTDGNRLVSVDQGILPPALVDFQKLYIKPLQVIILQISSEFENLPLLQQRNHGDDIKTSSIGWLIRNDLCTTLAKLLHVGLSTGPSLLKSLFGRVQETTLWQVVRDFSIAYGSNSFMTIVGYVERSRWLLNDDMKFRYFVCELLNRSTMDGSEKLIVTWFRNFPNQMNLVHKYYVPNSFWRMYTNEHFALLVDEIVKSLMLFNGIPFHLHDFFEMQLLKLRNESVSSVRATSHSGPSYPGENDVDDIVCVFE